VTNTSVIERLASIVNIDRIDNSTISDTVSDSVRKIKRLHAHNALVPVICEDMFIYTNHETGESQSLHSYIIERIITHYRKKGKTLSFTKNELLDTVSDVYYGFSLLRNKIGKDIYEDIYNSIIDDEDNLIEGVELKPEVKNFLLAAKFPLIVTTTCFPIIEKYLSEYTSYYNHLENRNDCPIPNNCIYHIFGKAKIEDPNWGHDDKMLLRFLRSIFSSEYGLKNLNSVINLGLSRKTLIILGNSAPDWLFRFIITPICGGDIYDNVKGLYMSIDDRKEDGGLDLFLHDIKFDKESQMFSVLKNVTDSLSSKLNTTNGHTVRKKYDFFISHASEDTESVRSLVEHLRQNGLKVWVDYENLKDGKYWQRIIDALHDSRYFMPFITEKFILKNKKNSDLQRILDENGFGNIILDSSMCIRMESVLEGVQIELLMADKLLAYEKLEPYSIPVILEGSTLFLNPINPAYIRNCSENSKLLPQSLFWGLQMYNFSPDDISSFKLDYNRYKSN